MDADAHGGLPSPPAERSCPHLSHAFEDLEPGEHGAQRIVLVRAGVAEVGDHAVALELEHRPAVVVDRGGARLLVVAGQLVHDLGVDPIGEIRRPDEVAEHRRELPAITAAAFAAMVVRLLDQPERSGVAGIDREHVARQLLDDRPVADHGRLLGFVDETGRESEKTVGGHVTDGRSRRGPRATRSRPRWDGRGACRTRAGDPCTRRLVRRRSP